MYSPLSPSRLPHLTRLCAHLSSQTCWPGSHRLVYYSMADELNWTPTDEFPKAMERVRNEIRPVQFCGELGDCVFTHHREHPTQPSV